MAFAISKRACLRNVQMMLVIGLIWLVPLGTAAQSLPTIEVCNDCSTDWQFSQAAFSAANPLPNQSEVVYVVNVTTEQTRVFRVTLIIFNSGGGGITPGEISFDVNVTEITGNPTVLDDVAAAVGLVKDLGDAMIQDIPAEDLQLPPGLDSAIDLIGPDTSSAGLNRGGLENALRLHFDSFWRQQTTGLSDLILRIANRLLGDGLANISGAIEVVFPDGTKVVVKIVSIDENPTELFEYIFEFDVNEASVTAPGISIFPQNSGQFSGFSASDLDNDLYQHLRDLALRFGIPVLWPDDLSGNCSTSMSCGIVEGETRCTVTVESCI